MRASAVLTSSPPSQWNYRQVGSSHRCWWKTLSTHKFIQLLTETQEDSQHFTIQQDFGSEIHPPSLIPKLPCGICSATLSDYSAEVKIRAPSVLRRPQGCAVDPTLMG